MKKILLLIALIGFIAIFSNVNTQAQCPDWIDWDANNDPSAHLIQLDADCWVVINFCWAEDEILGNGILFISSVEFIGDCDLFVSEFAYNPGSMLDEFALELFNVLPSEPLAIYPCAEVEFPINNENFVFQRLGYSSCWPPVYEVVTLTTEITSELQLPAGTQAKLFEPCNSVMTNSVCWKLFYYCYDNSLPPIIETHIYETTAGSMPCPENCQHVCY